MTAFVDSLQYIRNNDGKFPPTLNSKEDQNELGHSGVPDHVVQIMQEEVVNGNLVTRGDEDIQLCFVDGFLLYSDPSVIKELDVRLLLRSPYEKLKARREARSGYVTLDGALPPLLVYHPSPDTQDSGKIRRGTLTRSCGNGTSKTINISLKMETSMVLSGKISLLICKRLHNST